MRAFRLTSAGKCDDDDDDDGGDDDDAAEMQFSLSSPILHLRKSEGPNK